MSFFNRTPQDTPAPPATETVPGDGPLRCRIKTSMGDMEAVLFEAEAPRTVANFVALALGKVQWKDGGQMTDRPLYSGTIFHRVIQNFMIQGGDPTGTGMGSPGWRFKDEFHPSRRHSGKGILSMANSGPNSNGSQFFICQKATPHLDGRHTVFGQVDKGLPVVDNIAAVRTGPGNRPMEEVKILEIEVWRGDA